MKIRKIGLAITALGIFSTALFANHNHDELKINTDISIVKWVGKKVTGQHNGTVSIKEGTFNVHDGELAGGKVVIDMTSIVCQDIEDEGYNQKLVGHLSSPDFFDVEKHPTATLKIIRVVHVEGNKHLVAGAFTIKGITKVVNFPATIQIKDGKLGASAEIKIDRTLFDIKYGSEKFFEDLGDKMIDDEFTINFKIGAN